MKTKYIIITMALTLFTINAQGQLLKKLKKRAEKAAESVLLRKTEEKTEQVVENAFDSIANNPNSGNSKGDRNNVGDGPESGSLNSKNSSVDHQTVNTEAKRNFYNTDVIVTTSENGKPGSSSFFDADRLAMKGTSPKGDIIYIDSEGFNYGYNESSGRWEKTGLMANDAMALMMPMMSLSIIQLPVGPTMEASENLKKQGLNANTFQLVEWAFIYKPEHFRTSGYVESSFPCGGKSCNKFHYTDPEYKGSYVEFDSEGRLSKVYANVNTPEGRKKGLYEFSYKPVDVSIPSATEVKMPFQDLFMQGLDVTNKPESQPTGAPPSGPRPEPVGNPASYPSQNSPNDNRDPGAAPNDLPQPNPRSFGHIGPNDITTVLRLKDQMIVLKLDVDKQLMEMDLKDQRMEPLVFDGNNHIYMVQGGDCIKAKFDMNKTFDQAVEGLKDKNLPRGFDVKESRDKYYETQMGMDLTIKKFPIVEWAYIIKEDVFKNSADFTSKTINCNNSGTCTMYTKNGSNGEEYVLFDKEGRLAEIKSTQGGTGTLSYTYHLKHNISTPTGSCQEIDMNQDVFAKLFAN